MFEDKRKLIIGGLIALLAVIIVLILLWLFWPKAKPTNNLTIIPPITSTQIKAEAPALIPVTPERLKEDQSYSFGLKQLATSFAERYGSYSTDEPTKNIDDLKPLMTPELIKRLAAAPQAASGASIFSGFSTKALSAQLPKIDANSATIIVSTQRTQTVGDGSVQKTFYQDVALTAIKVGNEWKIDTVKWQ